MPCCPGQALQQLVQHISLSRKLLYLTWLDQFLKPEEACSHTGELGIRNGFGRRDQCAATTQASLRDQS